MLRRMPLAPGDSAPEFSLTDQRGEVVELSSLRGQPLVVFFYPRDHTPMCTRESCHFRDEYERFQEANTEVLGISSDNQSSHASFAEKHDLPYRILSDPGGKIARAFGIPQRLGLMPARVTFTIDAQGIIRHVTHSDFSAARHVTEALLALQQLR